ncbi:DUF2523 family protein [Acinetobacter ursingii]|uniref:DUF2523 family protein n=1 Tax=Acinetobacter ursingii TaxID=108980 RepID=UPI0035566146
MPALAGLLAWFASYLITSVVVRLFVTTGLSIVSFMFVNNLVSNAKDAFQASLMGIPSDSLAFIQLWKIDQGISIIFSALTIAAYIKTAKVAIGRSS